VAAGLLASVGTAWSQTAFFYQSSDPVGIVDQAQVYTIGDTVDSLAAPLSDGSLRFAEWQLNGSPVRDATGAAPHQFDFSLSGESSAVARYLEASLDADADGLPDWWELRHVGSLDLSGSDDPDADTLNLSTEYQLGYLPHVVDAPRHGGISSVASAELVFYDPTASYKIVFESSQAGVFEDVVTVVLPGEAVVSPSYPLQQDGYRFTGWMMDGTRLTDPTGRALFDLAVVPTESTTIQAAYIAETLDADSDGLPDWWELQLLGDLAAGADADPDSDGFTLLEEYKLGYQPMVVDTVAGGGLSHVGSALLAYSDPIQSIRIDFSSDPEGLITTQTSSLILGDAVATPDAPLAVNDYRFVGWYLDGTRQTDGAGRALFDLSLLPTGSAGYVARYVDQAEDSDADNLPDWWELHYLGALTFSGTDDPDADGLNLTQEYQADYSPLVADQPLHGGLSSIGSATVSLNLAPYRQQIVSVAVNNPSYGAVTGTGSYLTGATVTVTATAADGFAFTNWAGDVPQGFESTNSFSFTATTSVSLTAYFVPVWDLEVSVSHIERGSVSVSDGDSYLDDSAATVTATAAPGYLFDSWSGDASGSSNPLQVNMDQHRTITAQFVEDGNDDDEDGLSNFEELITYNTNPSVKDSSGDGLSDGDIVAIGLDPNYDYSSLVGLVDPQVESPRSIPTKIKIVNGNVVLSLEIQLERSNDLTTWTQEPAEEISFEIPITADQEFFRFKL
jgi:uncharacterized repeat protein (TIGR02543 family)|tara:strand:- start:1170 stop:3368 length:2199 start_codon:yes stop_codon:yes gene_type:complete